METKGFLQKILWQCCRSWDRHSPGHLNESIIQGMQTYRLVRTATVFFHVLSPSSHEWLKALFICRFLLTMDIVRGVTQLYSMQAKLRRYESLILGCTLVFWSSPRWCLSDAQHPFLNSEITELSDPSGQVGLGQALTSVEGRWKLLPCSELVLSILIWSTSFSPFQSTAITSFPVGTHLVRLPNATTIRPSSLKPTQLHIQENHWV